MLRSESIGELAKALALAQGEIQNAKKDSENPFFKSKYADLASVREACNGPLSKNQLAVIQTPRTEITQDATIIFVSTLLAHSSGEWISEELSAIPVKSDPQGIGSCITYLRRYALASVAGVAPEEDDGNAASQGNGSYQPTRKPSPKENAPQKPNAAEREQIQVAIVGACKLLNAAGDKPTWGSKRLNEFAKQEYGQTADNLEIEPLRELLKKLSNKVDAMKKASKEAPNAVTANVTDRVEAERQAKIKGIQESVAREAVDEAIERLKYNKPLTELTLDQLVALSEEIIPF